MTSRACLACGAITRRGSYCGRHQAQRDQAQQRRKPSRSVHASRRWQRLSRDVITEWVAQHGWTCPGYGGDGPHVATDLTCDHIVPLSGDGAAFDRENLQVLCRYHNSAKAAKETP